MRLPLEDVVAEELRSNPELKAAFEKEKATNPVFAKDASAQLFYVYGIAVGMSLHICATLYTESNNYNLHGRNSQKGKTPLLRKARCHSAKSGAYYFFQAGEAGS